MSGFRSVVQRGHARELRANMTAPERILWRHLRAHRLMGLSVRRQAPIGPFIVDFLEPCARLVIEIDGGQHGQDGADVGRDAWLAARGCRILRFWNHEVLNNLDGVLAKIAEAAQGPLP